MKIGCVSIVFHGSGIVAIKCAKDRGIILPGGKLEPPETFKDCAKRELYEETGLIATKQRLIFQAPSGADDYYVLAFHTEIEYFVPKSSDEGQVVLVDWPELLASKFKGYYQLLKDVCD